MHHSFCPRGVWQIPPTQADTTPLGKHPPPWADPQPWADNLPLGRYPPGRHPPGQTAAEAGGTHPTGMLSCLFYISPNVTQRKLYHVNLRLRAKVCTSYLELGVDHPNHVEVQRVQSLGSVQCDDSSPSNLFHHNLITTGGTHPLQTQQLHSSV